MERIENEAGINPATEQNGRDGIESGNQINEPVNTNGIAKRKRGRPVGSGKKASSDSDTPASGTGPEYRAKPRNAENKTSKNVSLDLSGLAAQLEGLHKLAALVLKNPLVEIDKSESEKLALAISNVAKEYDLRINPAVMAWIQLVGVSAAIYGPRIALSTMARKKMAENKPVIQDNPLTGSGKMVYQ